MIVALTLTATAAAGEKPYLSNLHATADSPIFTTYAAAPERSEFALDEGYHLRFYDPERGIDLVTDTAGDLGLAFRRGEHYVYELADVAAAPVITTSYPDLVEYHYRPFADLRVEVRFLVWSSHAAVQEIALRNLGDAAAEVELVPFLRNEYRTFEDVRLLPDRRSVTFSHEEIPDGWTVDHGVPYVDRVQDLLLVSPPADRLASYRSYRPGNVRIPQQVERGRESVFLLWGRAEHADGRRCAHAPVRSRFMVTRNGDRRRLVTENAPRWGNDGLGVDRYGYYRVELGHFGRLREGDRFQLSFCCGLTGQCGAVEAAPDAFTRGASVRHDVALGPSRLPPAPTGVRCEIGKDHLDVTWEASCPDCTYNVYRRVYDRGGVYEQLSAQSETSLRDQQIVDGQVVGYLVTAIDADGRMSMPSEEANNLAPSDLLTDVHHPGRTRTDFADRVRVIAAPRRVRLDAGATYRLRVVRAVAPAGAERAALRRAAEVALDADFDRERARNEALFAVVPRPALVDPDLEMVYWGAFALMRQLMLPPEGRCGYTYYLFSREPTWGWGHGGQVFHESLTMLAYAYLDPAGAMDSQRVYRERQHPDGYVNYRTGPYLDETIPTGGQLTTSAPWYAWINWEIYRITGDRAFLAETYPSSVAFYRHVVGNRDRDGDGLCEWGGHAVLESVRDAAVAVWDEVDWPTHFEALDMNVMLVSEARALAAMAAELGRDDEAAAWRRDAEERSARINELMWDEATGFYYHVDRGDHDFSHRRPDDLKRREIIGFLPLWAGVAPPDRARRLVATLTDPDRFWRRYGVPTLAADDPYYNPRGYWNGPVWVEWAYLVERGLLRYGYENEARELAERVARGIGERLAADHTFWEFYSPDDSWGGYHQVYFWAGLVSRMLLDVDRGDDFPPRGRPLSPGWGGGRRERGPGGEGSGGAKKKDRADARPW